MKFLVVLVAVVLAANAASVDPEIHEFVPDNAPAEVPPPPAEVNTATPLAHNDLPPFPDFPQEAPRPQEPRGWLARTANRVAESAQLAVQVVSSGLSFIRGLVTGESRGANVDFNSELTLHGNVPAAAPIVTPPTPATQATPPAPEPTSVPAPEPISLPAPVPIVSPPTPAAQATPPTTPSAESVGPTGPH